MGFTAGVWVLGRRNDGMDGTSVRSRLNITSRKQNLLLVPNLNNGILVKTHLVCGWV